MIARSFAIIHAVPFMIHDAARGDRYEIDAERAAGAGIANVTATCLELLGFEAPAELAPSLVRFR